MFKLFEYITRLLLIALFGIIGSSPFVYAEFDPNTLEFKRVRGKRTLTLKNCPLVSQIARFEVSKRRRKITPARRHNRKSYRLPERYSFLACGTDDEGTTALYAKQSVNGEITQHAFRIADFPELPEKRGLNRVCPSGTRGIGFGILYKPAADASDARAGKPVVLLQGSNKNRAPYLRIYSSGGEEVCRFTFKASSIPGVNGGSDHYFSGWSGGCGKTSSQLSAAAGGSIYIEWKNGQCLGPVNPYSRVGGIG
ncbi:MAG: hypothetical protein DCC75_03930 [Proteobacteria bacterium]|nr:MAG: hypothetical protein DCC75_03930 [Pseudomonadota bacterium]